MNISSIVDGIDYGPLAFLIGRWKGDKGMDVAPELDGPEENPYYETLLFEAVGDVTNAESQTLAALRYHQVVTRKLTNQVFHNETGYMMWDSNTGIVMQSLTIPRGVGLLAGGSASIGDDGFVEIELAADIDHQDWGIVQSPFMKENARTVRFHHKIVVKGDELSYLETTVLEIYDKQFDHTDANSLRRI